VCGQAAKQNSTRGRQLGLRVPTAGQVGPVLCTVLLTIGLGWATIKLDARARAKSFSESVTFSQTPAGASAAELRAAIDRLQPIAARRLDDYRVQTRMAKLWTHLYRVTVLPGLRREAPPDVDLGTLWEQTSPLALHQQIHEAVRRGDAASVATLRGDASVREFLWPALRHQILARDALPVRAIAHLRLAPLSVLVSEPPGDLVHAQRARRCDPSHPEMLFQIGQLLLQAGQIDQACSTWRDALQLDWEYRDEILAFAEPRLPKSTLVSTLFPESPALLIQLLETRYAASGEAQEMRDAILERTTAAIEQLDLPDAERYYWRGRVAAIRQDRLAAIRDYVFAIELRPDEVQWRYELARLLLEHGFLEEARKQAGLCARQKPADASFQALEREINQLLLQES
jgi:tetratricopeptide (TPR) repeat protein